MRLRDARNRAGLSQTELGRAIGKSKDSVSQWEREKMGVSWETLRDLAKALDVDEYWLRDGQALPVGPTGRPKAPDFTIVREGVTRLLADVKAGRTQLEGIEQRLARLESAVLILLDEADRVSDETAAQVSLTRRTKSLLAEGLDAQADAPATEAGPRTRGEGDASPEAAPARRAGTRRSASKRGR